MSVAIIDYGSGNLRSAARAFERVAEDASAIQVTRSPEVVAQASHVVLPGVGAFADCVAGLKALPGMIEAMEEQVLRRGRPFLGICVGMQMLFERGHEHGMYDGLGWLKGEVAPIVAKGLKIPHMGWNDLTIAHPHPLLEGIMTGDHAYFVHSYYAACRNSGDMLATVSYGQIMAAVVGRGNIMGTQFHPEKSQETGLRLLKNFLSMK
ncbi:MAG: imidazole glycerol phosphate synthase subunit HisH [Pseudomonadota bacterium]|nr:imidazole glycerol phosphate synthase subunit HisH [Pseudomonadota bacterium]MDE3038209.1 imidazole glycerol phosphate synthase subunit HisH [Pseudomonadota bacterium]